MLYKDDSTIYEKLKRESEETKEILEREREREVWYIALALGQAWCFADR